ncbi:glycosyltransferase [Polynucleobacter paneuropaeus]|nr:glycosyltransferase [Polynucleobacter paneuropaeus]
MPLVSVLLCSNRIDQYLYDSVESILAQNYYNLELIVVLNGSALKDYELLKLRFSSQEKIIILSTSLAGLTHSLNLGLDHAKGIYIARMDSDDLAYVCRISQQVEFLEKNSDISICGSAFNLIDAEGNILQKVKVPLTDLEIRNALFYKNPICHPTVMFRKKVICRVGGYQTNDFAEDYNLWVRLARDSKVKFANLDSQLLGYRKVSLGNARGSKAAYRSASVTQWNEFLYSRKLKWCLSSVLSLVKSIFFGK